MGDTDDPELLDRALQQTNYRQVVVTGHSLGAGTAAILTFLLRAKLPNIRVICYAYSPPGGLLDVEASTESEKFCMSVVVGDDVIPRTSLHNITALSQDIKRVLPSGVREQFPTRSTSALCTSLPCRFN